MGSHGHELRYTFDVGAMAKVGQNFSLLFNVAAPLRLRRNSYQRDLGVSVTSKIDGKFRQIFDVTVTSF